MKKLVNNPDVVVDEMIDGYLKAFPKLVEKVEGSGRALVAKQSLHGNGKVGIVIGGGSGHEPAFMGYIGRGMADGVAVGNIFASPPPQPIVEATEAVNQGNGVVYIYGNYAGDIMNFGMASDLADMEHDIKVESIIVRDDVASAPKREKEKRRGIAGEFFVTKVAGAASARGDDLSEVVRLTNKANESVRSMGVGLTPCALPQTGKPSFVLGDNEMEIGLGHHGEPGVEKGPLQQADDVCDRLIDDILNDGDLKAGDDVAVLVNGLGSTTQMELFIMFRRVEQRLSEKQINIHRSYVGNYSTSMEMGGCSVTLMKVDEELKALIDAPAECPLYAQYE